MYLEVETATRVCRLNIYYHHHAQSVLFPLLSPPTPTIPASFVLGRETALRLSFRVVFRVLFYILLRRDAGRPSREDSSPRRGITSHLERRLVDLYRPITGIGLEHVFQSTKICASERTSAATAVPFVFPARKRDSVACST